MLYLIFFPRDVLPINTKVQHTWKTAVTVAVICLAHGLLVILVTTALAFARPAYLGPWANILGITATILTAIQYFPQIWMTYRLKSVGSFSIPMMLIQTPGSFVWAGSLAVRLGPEGWNTWGIYLVTGFLQGNLLCMGIWYEIRARKGGLVEAEPVSFWFALDKANSRRSTTDITSSDTSRKGSWRQMMRAMRLLEARVKGLRC